MITSFDSFCYVATGLGFVTSVLFTFFIGIFASSWLGSTVFWLGEQFIRRMPFVRHLYSASKQISTAISPGKAIIWFKHLYAVSVCKSECEFAGSYEDTAV